MFPDINEDGAEIVANILADALIKAEHEFIVKKWKLINILKTKQTRPWS